MTGSGPTVSCSVAFNTSARVPADGQVTQELRACRHRRWSELHTKSPALARFQRRCSWGPGQVGFYGVPCASDGTSPSTSLMPLLFFKNNGFQDLTKFSFAPVQHADRTDNFNWLAGNRCQGFHRGPRVDVPNRDCTDDVNGQSRQCVQYPPRRLMTVRCMLSKRGKGEYANPARCGWRACLVSSGPLVPSFPDTLREFHRLV